jgi:chemotaxis protein CheC
VQLNADQEDAIREIINIGIGRAAATLSDLLGTRVELKVPRVTLRLVGDGREAEFTSPDGRDVAIIQDFRGDISGRAALVLGHASGLRLAQLLGDMAEPVDELDLEMSGILTEVGNIMLNSVLGALANIIRAHLVYTVPHCFDSRPINSLLFPATLDARALLSADADFWVRHDSIQGTLVVVIEPRGLEAILAAICAVEV